MRGSENGLFEVNQYFGTEAKRDVVWMLISRVGDLVISGADSFTAYISGRLEMITV